MIIVPVTLYVEVDENSYPNLKKEEIRKIVKSFEQDGSCRDYVTEMAKSELENANFANKKDKK